MTKRKTVKVRIAVADAERVILAMTQETPADA